MQKQKIDAKLFNIAKMLSSAGASIDEIAEHLKISPATISRIRAAETFEEYKQMLAARALAYKAAHKGANKPEEPVTTVTTAPVPREPVNPTVVRVEATHYMMEELRKLNETMTLISNKLALIVDQLT